VSSAGEGGTVSTTVIKNAAWVAAYDTELGGHVYLQDVDVAFTGDRIVHVGPDFAGEADLEIDGRRRFVMPGLVNVHSHPLSEPMNKGFLDELGSPGLYNSSLFEFMPIFRPDGEGMVACARMALAELLVSGVTTLVDLAVPYDGWIDTLAASGIRGVAAPMYRSARWFTRSGHVVEYEWDEAAGRRAMDDALAIVDALAEHPSGRLSGMIAPAQIDTCTAELVRDSFEAARERGLTMQIHAAQSVVEFHELTRRHGLTAVQWLDQLGVLGPDTVIGHGIFFDHHTSTHWPRTRDLARVIATGTAVAHCPTVFQRRGITLQTLGRYLREGVRIGVGTDTYPHNMLEELRTALYLSRVVSQDVFDLRTRDVFTAATLGGADILKRDDIGRLAVGAKADLVAVDLDVPAMHPLRDPLKSLIYAAAERAVGEVWVDGRRVVADGRCLTIDHAEAARAVTEAQRRAAALVPERDWAGREHWTIAEPVLPFADRAD
jgi:cytosine/adenosine deaminase-related metal-dependent hydrolase